MCALVTGVQTCALPIFEELNTAGHLRNDGVFLRLAGLEQFSTARQTAGDVAGLGSFAGNTSQHVASLHCLPILDRQGRADGQHVTPGFAAIRVEQSQAWTQILLRSRGATILADDALGDARCFVSLLD